MEEEKAAAYYDELTRKGEGAARFKQGLGFSSHSSDSTTNNNPKRGSALPSSSSFLSNFVRASSPGKSSEIEKQMQLENIRNKFKKKESSNDLSRVSDRRRSSSRERDRSSRRRSRSRDGHDSRRKHRSASRERGGNQDRDREERSERRSGSRSRSSLEDERRHRGSSRDRHSRGRRSSSPKHQRSENRRGDGYRDRDKSHKDRNGGVDYSRLINGYAEMTAAERVKAKMKLQLSQTVEKDTAKGMGAGWERFEFDKDAPLDDEEIEVAEDDALVVKNLGQSFRFSAVEARREEQIKAAHDEAMFGAPAAQPLILSDKDSTIEEDRKEKVDNKETNEDCLGRNLMSEKVLAKQQGSWRDRARKVQDGSKS